MSRFPQVRKLDSPAAVRDRLGELGVELPVRDGWTTGDGAPLSRPLEVFGRRCTNRFAVLPMEGWDGTDDGRPTELVARRWHRFGESGAALVWGGEAVAVRPDGRANPHQLVIDADRVDGLARLRAGLVDAHAAVAGHRDDPVVGLQLTHSGRFARPDGTPRPRTAYRHPVLDDRVGARAGSVLSDDELDELVGRFVDAAGEATDAGFDFVDVKACHGYLGHELLSAVDRPGRYGGDLDGRSRFLRSIVTGIRARHPELGIGVRLSVFDRLPYRPGADGTGVPEPWDGPYPYAFGGDGTGLGADAEEVHALCSALVADGVGAVCISGGSPYYNPHIQRPAYFPPSDGYQPPEDPLVGVARLVRASAELAGAHPDLVVVASGLTYLQEWIPHVAEALVDEEWADVVGLGRMMLSYPDLPADVLAGRALRRPALCRTFSDCTTAPRNGLASGCYPLDPFYKGREERVALAAAKKAARRQVAP